MKKSIVILIYLILNAILAFSQSKYEKGYVVTSKNDTIYGQLQDRSAEPFGKIFKKVRIKGFWIFGKRYGPKDLNSYKIGNNTYESIWYDSYSESFSINHISTSGQGEKVFMRLAVDGNLKLYWDEFRDPDSGYEQEIPFFKKTNSSEMIRVTQGVFRFKKKVLGDLFADCPELTKHLNDDFFNNPEEIAVFYNEKCN